MSEQPSATEAPTAACAISGHLDTRTAATEVAHELHDSIGRRSDLVIVFASYHHRAALREAIDTVRQTIGPRTLMAVTTEGVLAGTEEREGRAGMSALALSLPNVTITPWTGTPTDPLPLRDPAALAQRIGFGDDYRVGIFIGEPFSTPITRLLPALASCGGERPVPIVGGMASGASQAGHNVLMLDDQVVTSGVIGVSLAGAVDVDFVVSQGCRPIGTPLVITKVTQNVILELGGRPALHVLHETAGGLDEPDRKLLQAGLLLGSVIDEHSRPFGRGDFLVRNVLGADQKRNGIVVGEIPRMGQTVQFHVRDAVTADEDLQLLLDAQVMGEKPFGALLFTCNGRGERLFGEPNHDLNVIADRLGDVPIAGFFAAGEIGPIGGHTHLHGHTASLALFR